MEYSWSTKGSSRPGDPAGNQGQADSAGIRKDGQSGRIGPILCEAPGVYGQSKPYRAAGEIGGPGWRTVIEWVVTTAHHDDEGDESE
ncbi:MAG: hypothetical protein D8M59_10560 [Planctomycetes bacterium]|nr:hypothetical protein [Planctomycetota bacterium]